MILKKVQIENFRSIKNETLDFSEDNCKILVGINEAGKSNVLKALNCYKQNYGVESIRRPKSDEEIEDYKISYTFCLSTEEKHEILSSINNQFYECSSKYFKFYDSKLTFSELIDLIQVNVFRKSDNQTTYNTNLSKFSFIEGIKSGVAREDICEDELPNGYTLDHTYFHRGFNCEFYEEQELTTSELFDEIAEFIKIFINKQKEKVIFWKYDEKNILPSEINYKEFLADPSINKTLQSLFELCGKEKWNEDILKKIPDRDHIDGYLENAYSKKILNYLKSKWPELKLKSFRIRVDGDMLRFSFIDEEDNAYNTKERSDGFKRFITFLILISAKNTTGEIKDTILIIDEPDLAIHIWGQRHLLNELLKISENNVVVFSTHSPFMIDKTNIGRHYIVKKENEVTSLTISSDSNFAEEEVLFQALGYSVFCNLKDKNILFEGYWDNIVFKLCKDEQFSNIGHVYMGGVKNAQSISKIIQLQDKDFHIVSDSDKPAKENKREFEKTYKNKWTEYDKYCHGIHTLEDFVNNQKIKQGLEKVIALKAYCNLKSLDLSFIDDLKFKKLDVLTAKCIQLDNNINKKDFQRVLKDKIFNNIKKEDILPEYNDFLNQLIDEI